MRKRDVGLGLALMVGAGGAVWAQGGTRPVARVQASAVKLDPAALKAMIGLKLNPVQVKAAAFAGGKTYVAGEGFWAQVGDDGRYVEQASLAVPGLRALGAGRPGFLLAASAREIHEVDLKTKGTRVVIRLDAVETGKLENDRLIKLGEIGGVASDGKFLFVATEAGYSSSIFKLEAATGKVVGHSFAPGPTPSSLQLDGGKLFVVDRQSQLLRRFDAALKLSPKSLPTPEGARAVMVDGDQIRAIADGVPTIVKKTAPVSAVLRTPSQLAISPAVIEKLKDIVAANVVKKYALLVCGDVAESGFDSFWNDTVWMYKMLKAKGYKPEDILVLYGNGNDFVSANPFYKVPEKVTDFAATTGNLITVLDGLKNGDAAKGIPKIDGNDSLFVWLFDHGGLTAGGEATLCMMNGSLTASQIAAKLNALSYDRRAIFAQQCFSGGFIPPLRNAKTYVSAACKANETAHVADTEREVVNGKTYTHGEFNYYVIAAFDKKYPTGAGVNADTITANGKISAKEANAWWVSKENRSETPQSDDMGGIGNGFYLQ